MRKVLAASAIAFTLFHTVTAVGQDIRLDVGDTKPDRRWVVLPFVFATESLETAYGISGGTSGFYQPQMSTFVAVMGSSNDTTAMFLSINDYQFQSLPRLFATFTGSIGDWTDHRTYAGYDPNFPGEYGGSNDSSDDNYFRGEGENNWFDMEFRFLIPTGDGRDNLINTFVLDQGIIESGAVNVTAWNPSQSGRLYFDTIAFFHERNFADDSGDVAGDTSGLEIALEYDNRNFAADPSKGSLQRLAFKRDFGWFKSTASWTNLELDLRKYLSLGESNWFRQRVLALNAWISYSPSWENALTIDGPTIENRPPSDMGASLGGFERLRAFPTYRFSDKAALLYTAELRLTSSWDPGTWRLLKFFDVDWVQLVPFLEVGRVANSWSISELHKDVKWDVGLGLRFIMRKAVFRVEVAVGENDSSTWVMVGHPF
jgi:hypothetical protein